MESTQKLVFEVTKNSSLAGIATGILHHSILQYPKQAKLFATLKAFFFVDALFLVLRVGSLTEFSIRTLGEIVLDLTLFNTLYVSVALVNSADTRLQLHFFSKPLTMSTSDIPISQPGFSGQQVIGDSGMQTNTRNHTEKLKQCIVSLIGSQISLHLIPQAT